MTRDTTQKRMRDLTHTFAVSTAPEDTPGTPEWKARLAADEAEYESFFVTFTDVNGALGSHRVPKPKKVPTSKQRRKVA